MPYFHESCKYTYLNLDLHKNFQENFRQFALFSSRYYSTTKELSFSTFNNSSSNAFGNLADFHLAIWPKVGIVMHRAREVDCAKDYISSRERQAGMTSLLPNALLLRSATFCDINDGEYFFLFLLTSYACIFPSSETATMSISFS